MDPLSISLGIAGILPLIASAITASKEYIDTVRSARESIANLVIELEALQSNAENLQELLKCDSLTNSSIRFQDSSVLRTCSAACETKLRSLCKKLNKDTNGKASRLLWPFNEKEYQKLIQEIRNFTNWMGFALSIEGCRLLSQTSDDMLELMGQQLEQFRTIQALEAKTLQMLDYFEDQRHVNQLSMKEETRKSILSWISTAKHDQKHQLIQRSRVQNTGTWILQKDKFLKWRNDLSSQNVLVCYGIQGSGKTNLASIIIDDLLESQSSESLPVAYFYFDYQDQSSQSTSLVLRCILRQILDKLPTIPNAVVELYDKSGSKGQIPLHECERLIADIASGLNCVYLIFDGLDESEHRTSFLRSIQNIVRNTKVRPLVTSRPHIHLGSIFDQHTELIIEAHPEDLELCLSQEISQARIYGIAGHEFVSMLMQKLMQNAEGMFLLPILQLRTIINEPTVGGMEDKMSDMSYSLSDAFEDTISRIQRLPESRSRLGMGALMWLCHTTRPLTAVELSDALAIRNGRHTVNSKYRPSTNMILECCQGLTTVDVEGYVRLSHYSIQEYLEEHSKDLFPKAEATIAVTCLRYFVFDDFNDGPWRTDSEIETRMGMYPLLTWASIYWGQFTRMTESDAEVWSALLAFFACPSATATANQVRQYSKGMRFEYYDAEECKSFSALHHAARHGLNRAITQLLDSGAYDVNKQTEMGSTPIILAASDWNLLTMRRLLEYGANPRLRNWYGDALHCAMESNEADTVRGLVSWGMDPNAIEDGQRSYLSCAMDRDSDHAFSTLVDLGADIVAQSAVGTQTHLLFDAALWGCERIVGLMLDRGWINIEMKNSKGQTAAHLAVISGSLMTMKRLLEAGISIDVADNKGHTALDYAEIGEDKAMMSLLRASKSRGTSRPYRQ